MGHADTPPELPEVTDEAPNTPAWVPLLGLVLFATAAVAIVISHGQSDGAADEAEATTQEVE
jgi:hypothetical protein